jgi:hypothetical protein
MSSSSNIVPDAETNTNADYTVDADADNAIAADAVIENIAVADAVVDAILPFDTPTLDTNYKTGRDASSVWSTFTEENDPQKLKSATCKHCKTLVTYHQKIHRAKKHLMKCAKYTRTMNSIGNVDGAGDSKKEDKAESF